jgi:hypothetical protein
VGGDIIVEPSRAFALFDSTSAALRAEKLATAGGVRVKLVPVPRHLSSDCGVCLRLEAADVARVGEILAAGRVPVARWVEESG